MKVVLKISQMKLKFAVDMLPEQSLHSKRTPVIFHTSLSSRYEEMHISLFCLGIITCTQCKLVVCVYVWSVHSVAFT